MREAVIAGYLRTAQSRSRPNDPEKDWFYKLRADDLLSVLLPKLLEKTGVKANEVEDCITGSALGLDENFTYGGRLPVFLSNLSETVAAKFVDQQCGSSMAASHIAAMEIMLGYADIVLAAGMEHMTRVPMGQTTREDSHVKLNPRLAREDALAHWDIKNAVRMGLTAEKIFSMRDFRRDELNQWAKRSHDLAVKARTEGFFDDEILPMQAEQADGSMLTVRKDQSVRENVSLESLNQLKPAFKDGGVITAGNSSPLNAGAASSTLDEQREGAGKGHQAIGYDTVHRFCRG